MSDPIPEAPVALRALAFEHARPAAKQIHRNYVDMLPQHYHIKEVRKDLKPFFYKFLEDFINEAFPDMIRERVITVLDKYFDRVMEERRKEKEESGEYSGSLDSAILRSSDNLIEDMVNGVKGALLELPDQIEGYDEVELSEYSNSDDENEDEHSDKKGQNDQMGDGSSELSDECDESRADDEPSREDDTDREGSLSPMDVDMEEDVSATPSGYSHNRSRELSAGGRGIARSRRHGRTFDLPDRSAQL